MKTVEEYRGFAEDCRKLAGALTDPKDKRGMELMATAWDKIANERAATFKRKPPLENAEGGTVGSQHRLYYFDVAGPGKHKADCEGISLTNDDAAFEYATRIIRELKASGGYDDPAYTIVVRCLGGEVVLSVPF
jgi:hypothetical protein